MGRPGILALLVIGQIAVVLGDVQAEVRITWEKSLDRTWVGPDGWANRLQDWRVADGRLECVEERGNKPMRTVHLLTHRLSAAKSACTLSIRAGLSDPEQKPGPGAAVGLLLGAGGAGLDYRAAALVHHCPGKGGGVFVGVDGRGQAFVRDFETRTGRQQPPSGALPRKGWRVIRTDSVELGNPGQNVIDGDPNTIWHTEWRQRKPKHPHFVLIDLGRVEEVGGLAYLPRQGNSAGRVERFRIYLGPGPESHERLVARGRFADSDRLQIIRFPAARGRYLRFVADSAHHDRPSTTMAELYLLRPGASPERPADETRSVTGIPADIRLQVRLVPESSGYRVQVTCLDGATGKVVSRADRSGVPPERLTGNIALVSHPGQGPNTARFWFSECSLSGAKIETHPERRLGPILSTQYTLHRGTLKLTAQMMPLGPEDTDTVDLQIKTGGRWRTVATAPIVRPGFTATFKTRVDDRVDLSYRVVYHLRGRRGENKVFTYRGTVRHDPRDRSVVTVAAFTGNNNCGFGADTGSPAANAVRWTADNIWFPHQDIVHHVALQRPDLLFFSGDQIYEGRSPTAPERKPLEKAELDYLYKWYLWCWAFRDLTRDIPCVAIPDDHDVYQGNLWGWEGRPAPGGNHNAGGYTMPPEFVNMVERTQTSHLPDPVDPAPVEQRIGVYFTDLLVGGVSFAIIEDRKFKSPPTAVSEAHPVEIRDGHIVTIDFDPRLADVPGAQLLGKRQLEFLRRWAGDWSGGAEFKAVLSQTIFANLQTRDQYPDHLDRDLDSDGWPQSGRRRALRVLRQAFAVHIAGDQHLGSLLQHGIDEHGDGPWSFCVPSIANFYLRFWEPPHPGGHHLPGMPSYTGEYHDGFGNLITVYAVSNPARRSAPEEFPRPEALHRKAPGYGIVRFDKRNRTITFLCWPRYADPRTGRPYPGWPLTVRQLDNGGWARARYQLPMVQINGMERPVVQVIEEETGEPVYTIRLRSSRWAPVVFRNTTYTLRVGDPDEDRWKIRSGVRPTDDPDRDSLEFSF